MLVPPRVADMEEMYLAAVVKLSSPSSLLLSNRNSKEDPNPTFDIESGKHEI